MKRAAKTLKSNREGVLNGYRHNKTNATAEGLNNSIKGDEADELWVQDLQAHKEALSALSWLHARRQARHEAEWREVRGPEALGGRLQNTGGGAHERHRAAAQRGGGVHGLDVVLRH